MAVGRYGDLGVWRARLVSEVCSHVGSILGPCRSKRNDMGVGMEKMMGGCEKELSRLCKVRNMTPTVQVISLVDILPGSSDSPSGTPVDPKHPPPVNE